MNIFRKKKLLVFGVIVLFIGLAFIPSFNAVSISKSDDTTPPIIDVTWETYKFNGTWYVEFTCEAYDPESGIDRVEYYINDKLQDTVPGGPGPPEYLFIIGWSKALKNCVFKFEAINKAGLSAFVEINGTDIKSNDDCDCGEGNDYPEILCAILGAQLLILMNLYWSTGGIGYILLKITYDLIIKFNCPF